MAAKTDRLYRTDSVPEDFSFNEQVVEVFDDMLTRSVPFYREVIDLSASLLDTLLEPGDTVCDLGCSTGSALLRIARRLAGKRLCFVGLDNSPPMLAKATAMAELYRGTHNISFACEDICAVDRPGTGAFICNYTLQFIRPVQRPELIARLYDNLRPGGILLLSEKTVLPDTRLNRSFIDMHHDFKRERGYSELEIARKREALENILIPFTAEENLNLLGAAGFSPATPFFQWFNFSSFIARKPA